MQRAKRPQDTGRGDGCWLAIVDRAPSLRQPWLQYAVRSLRPCHQAHLERSSGGLRGRLRNRRWQAFARKDAVYAETGRTFDQLTAECCTTSDNPRGRHKTTDIPGDRQFAPCYSHSHEPRLPYRPCGPKCALISAKRTIEKPVYTRSTDSCPRLKHIAAALR